MIFKDFDTYHRVRDAKVINSLMFANLYRIPESDILDVVYFDPAKPHRDYCTSNPFRSTWRDDVYGAQQHAPLMNFSFNL